MSLARLWTIARLELTQRVRTASWYVLLGVFAALLVGITALSFLSYSGLDDTGSGVYAIVVCFTLLLVLLVSPTLSGNSINGDRDAATLAPVQVTLARTGEILLGKLLAAWLTGLAFVLVAVPFLIVATFGGGVSPTTVAISLVVMLVETLVVSAIGVALSGILARPLFSVATTYLVVAALTIGTLIGFGLGGTSIASEGTFSYRSAAFDPVTGDIECIDGSNDCWNDPERIVCDEWTVNTMRVPRFDYVWWMLAANPFVILADAVPMTVNRHGYPTDLFGQVKLSVRQVQLAPELDRSWDECSPEDLQEGPTATELVAQTVPSWFAGLGVQVLLAALLVWRAWVRTATPARRLPPGTRIA